MVIHLSFGKMICYSAILFFLSLLKPTWGQESFFNPEPSFAGLADLLSNLVSVDNSDLVFISDFQTYQQVTLAFLLRQHFQFLH